jgi:hypothetical protein
VGGCPYRKSNPHVLMVQSTKHRIEAFPADRAGSGWIAHRSRPPTNSLAGRHSAATLALAYRSGRKWSALRINPSPQHHPQNGYAERMIAPERLPALRRRPPRRTIYLAMLVWPTSMPSLSSSPWIRGAPHKGLAMLISRINCRTSVGTAGRP